jgi:phenylacetate-coenzyme A ligase PaaK-like adenylate-forming protein
MTDAPLATGLPTPAEALRWSQYAWDAALGGWLQPIDILRRSRTRLDALIAFARAEVPLYRQHYRGLPPHADLPPSALPPLTRQDLTADLEASLSDRSLRRSAIEAFVADPRRIGELLDGRYAVWSSSGSTGAPALYLHDRDALALYQALELFRFRGLASPAQLAARVLAGERYALVSATGSHFAGVSTIERLRRGAPWLASAVRSFSLMQPLDALTAELDAYQPTLLATYPTAAELLADEQAAGRLHLAPAEVWLGGETLTRPTRSHLTRAFGCPVRNAYGASEFLSIGWDCSEGRLHANADWVLLEPVDARYRPVEPGCASHTTLLTNLANRVQPLIRYDLGDSITVLPERCACGCVLPAIEVEGRHDDILHFAARGRRPVRVLPLVLTTVLEEQAGLHDYQVVQQRGRLLLRLGRADRAQAARAEAVLRQYLHAQGVARVDLRVVHAAPRKSTGSGKLRRVLREDR